MAPYMSAATQELVAMQKAIADRQMAAGDKEGAEFTLSKMFQQIYSSDGEGSMFKQSDLVRFSILAAGGLLTGGSLRGSIRYAAGDALKNSDGRATAKAAAESANIKYQRDKMDVLRTEIRDEERENNKAIRSENANVRKTALAAKIAVDKSRLDFSEKQVETVRNQVFTQQGQIDSYLSKDVSPENRSIINKLIADMPSDFNDAQKADYQRQVLNRVASMVEHDGADGSGGKAGTKPGTPARINGETTRVIFRGNKAYRINEHTGGETPLGPNDRYMPEGQYQAERNAVITTGKVAFKKQLGEIRPNDDRNETDAENMAHQIAVMWNGLGMPDANEWQRISDTALKGIPAADLGKMSSAALERNIMGNMLIDRAPTTKDVYYRLPDGGETTFQGRAVFAGSIQQEMRQVNDELTKRGEMPLNVGNMADIAQRKWDSLPKQGQYYADAVRKATRVGRDKSSPYYGMSAMMIWVKDGMPGKPKKE
jgi:hypothetical protein